MQDAFAAIAQLAVAGAQFDLILADPPYGEPAGVLRARAGGLLADGGLFVLQTDRSGEAPALEKLTLVERRDYGRNVFLFYASDPSARPAKQL